MLAETAGSATANPGLVTVISLPGVRHLDGANVAFMDGHVKWMLPVRINATLNGSSFYYWNRVKP